MNKFTAGPWELDSAKDGDSRYQIIHGQLPAGINGDFGYPVADTMNRHHAIAPDEDRANGVLIAKAPALLAALEKLLPALNSVIDSFTLDIPEQFSTLAEDVAAAEKIVKEAKNL